jgi:hypothetical protein
LPVIAAAKRLNYTTDHVAKLCREGKLDCIQIGAAWTAFDSACVCVAARDISLRHHSRMHDAFDLLPNNSYSVTPPVLLPMCTR